MFYGKCTIRGLDIMGKIFINQKGWKIYIPKFRTEVILHLEAPDHFPLPNISNWKFASDIYYTREFY